MSYYDSLPAELSVLNALIQETYRVPNLHMTIMKKAARASANTIALRKEMREIRKEIIAYRREWYPTAASGPDASQINEAHRGLFIPDLVYELYGSEDFDSRTVDLRTLVDLYFFLTDISTRAQRNWQREQDILRQELKEAEEYFQRKMSTALQLPTNLLFPSKYTPPTPKKS